MDRTCASQIWGLSEVSGMVPGYLAYAEGRVVPLAKRGAMEEGVPHLGEDLNSVQAC